MASLAEASMASVPVADLETLQAQLLRGGSHMRTDQRSEKHHAKLTQASLQNHMSGSNDATGEAAHKDASIADDASCTSQVAESQVAARPPDVLRPGSSAPQATTKLMEGHISQPRLLATTFHGGLGGDTQVDDTQVYKQLKEQAAREAYTTPHRPLHVVESTTGGKSIDDNTCTNLGGVDEDNDGSFIDFNLSPGGKSDVSDMHSMLECPRSQLPKSIKRPSVFPDTPQLAGHKRGSDGELRSEDTPGLEGLFGPAKTPLLTTTQLFQRTQAVSSPLPDGVRSDPVITRPSPNLQDDAVFTSHPAYSSSPDLGRHYPAPMTTLEPRDKYVSMQESQKRRTQFNSTALQALPEEDPFDNSDARRLDHHRLRRVLSHQAIAECRSVSAPARPSMPSVTVHHAHVSSPPQPPHDMVGEDFREPIDISDDEEADSDVEEDIAARPEEDNDAYDEFAQAVVESSGKVRDHDDVELAQSLSDDDPDLDMQDADTHVLSDDVQPEVVPGSPAETGGVYHTTQPTSLLSSQVVPQSEKRSLLATTNQQGSSITSVVPGSQYSQLTNRHLVKQSRMWPHPQPESSSRGIAERRTPGLVSSPFACQPTPSAYADASMHLEHTSPVRSKSASDEQSTRARISESVQGATASSEIRTQHSHMWKPSTLLPAFGPAIDADSEEQAYATAQTRLSPSRPPTAEQGDLATESQHSMATPLRRAGARRAADIANMPTQLTVDHDLSAEIDDAAGVLHELEEYGSAASPRVHRKRKASMNFTLGNKRRRRDERTITSSNSTPARSSNSLQGLDQPDHRPAATRQAADGAATENTIPDVEVAVSLQAHDSTDGAHGRDVSSDADTPKSVRVREAAGSAAVSQLLSARSAREQQPSKLSGPGKRTYARKGRLRSKHTTQALQHTEPDEAAEGGVHPDELPALPTTDTSEPASVLVVAPPISPSTSAVSNAPDATTDEGSTSPLVARTDRVFALFKNSRLLYYPATKTGQSAGPGLVHVRFDDGSDSNVKPSQLAPLDLRIGDVIRVDINNMRNHWTIQGFVPPTGDGGANSEESDIYGHTMVLVVPKNGKRASLPDQGGFERVKVSDIYLSPSMLGAYKGRTLTVSTIEDPSLSGPATPTCKTTSNSVNTPRSRSGRQAARNQQYILPSSSAQSSEVLRAPKPRKSGDVFSNMAFAVTISGSAKDGETSRKEWIDEIEANGGQVFDDFSELFEESGTLQRRTSKSGQQDGATSLRIKAKHDSLGFVALISDKHCRKKKYTQALALGIPTLSFRWVTDSLDKLRSSASGTTTVASWSTYLLPAGESAYLGDAVRSRTLDTYHTEHTSFKDTFDNRQLLLDGDKVLIVMPRKDKSALADKRQSYAFLTLAMGASEVQAVEDIEAAAKLITIDDSWRYIMVDGNVEQAVEDFDPSTRRGSKKRRAATEVSGPLSWKSKDGRHTIISHEFVMQSLILGALVE